MKKESVTRKSKSADLFSRLCRVYAPWMSGYPPPDIVIDRARVWRGREGPDKKHLRAELGALGQRGLSLPGVWFLIGLCESLFRPLRAVELAMEPFFPRLLSSRNGLWPPDPVTQALLKSDFRQLWNEQEAHHGKGWVLAAGAAPLKVRHRPPLLAPWVVGVTVKRWLMDESEKAEDEKGRVADESAHVAMKTAEVLLGQRMRPEELRHWQKLLEKIEVLNNSERLPLPDYLVRLTRHFVAQQMPINPLTPQEFLVGYPLNTKACKQFGRTLVKGWGTWGRKSLARTLPGRIGVDREEDPAFQIDDDACIGPDSLRQRGMRCSRCSEQSDCEEIFDHLSEKHGISKDSIEMVRGGRQLRRKVTGELLATRREK